MEKPYMIRGTIKMISVVIDDDGMLRPSISYTDSDTGKGAFLPACQSDETRKRIVERIINNVLREGTIFIADCAKEESGDIRLVNLRYRNGYKSYRYTHAGLVYTNFMDIERRLITQSNVRICKHCGRIVNRYEFAYRNNEWHERLCLCDDCYRFIKDNDPDMGLSLRFEMILSDDHSGIETNPAELQMVIDFCNKSRFTGHTVSWPVNLRC